MSEVPVRDAATVVLLRDGEPGIQAWLLTRVTAMAFAAGMTVFPGGRVDPGDAELPLAGPLPQLAARLDCPQRLARALLGAAVRETFEETGVLLTVPPAQLPAHARADVEAGRVGFGQLLAEHGLQVDAAALHPWARWVTPPGEARRYDTRFFLGALPPGAQALPLTTEASAASWVPVGEALAQAHRGERKMLPPTLATLTALAGFATVADAVAAAPGRRLDPVHPRLRRTASGTLVAQLPDGTSFELPTGLLP